MYARYPRKQFALPTSPYSFQPSSQPMNTYSYQASPYYDQYDGMYDYAPTELEALEWEEQRLLEQEAALLAERKRVAAEKRRLQLEEQERRRREWEIERAYLERRRQEQHAMKQQQIRQRQLAAQKEAQLESALRALEYDDTSAHGARLSAKCTQPQAVRATQCQSAKSAHSAPASPVLPLSWLIQAFSPEANQVTEPVRRAAPTKTQTAQSKPSSSASRTSHASTSAASRDAPKRSGLVDALQSLRQRVSNANKQVSDLLSTNFDCLTLRQFGSVDNELMQILLALDNINVETDSTRAERKALVSETMSLLDRVDQYKDQFSRSSSEASDAHSNADTSSQTSSDHDTMMAVDEDEIVEEIDADSNASDVESSSEASTVPINITSSSASESPKPIESYHTYQSPHEAENTKSPFQDEETIQISSESGMDIQQDDSSPIHEAPVPSISNEEPKADTAEIEENDTEAVEWDEDDDHTEQTIQDDEATAASEKNAMQVDDSSNTIDQNSPTSSSSVPLDDPFGFHLIHEAAKKSSASNSNSQSSDSIPIQIGNSKKSSVVIEPAPASQ